jgi:hypothetical protein
MKSSGLLLAMVLALVACGSGAWPAPSASPSPPAPSVAVSPTSARDGLEVCTPAQVSITLTTDRPDYHVGQPVVLSIVINNRSDRACHFPSLSCVDPHYTITDSAGHVVDAPPAPGCPYLPGDDFGHAIPAHHTDTTTGRWDQEVNTSDSCLSSHCPTAPPGVYHAAETAQGLGVTARTEFTILP